MALPKSWFNVIAVGGPISGKNPNSVTQAMPIYKKAIEKTKATLTITMLGEVERIFDMVSCPKTCIRH